MQGNLRQFWILDSDSIRILDYWTRLSKISGFVTVSEISFFASASGYGKPLTNHDILLNLVQYFFKYVNSRRLNNAVQQEVIQHSLHYFLKTEVTNPNLKRV